jgi:acetylornithine/N-succinyldiaminopimelate aminotransferase
MNLFNVYPLYDITPVKATDCTIIDDKGVEYLDLYSGHGVISIGHTQPDYVAKLKNQIDNLGFYSNAIQNPLQVELAQKLGNISGLEDYELFLCSSGAEANENAFKLASFYNGRKKIIAFRQGFHGRTSLAVAATDNPKIVAPINENTNIAFLPLNDIEAFEKAFDEDVCCVIIEGIQGVGGINIPNNGFLQHLEKRCNQNNSILILDEVQSGYGRTGKFFAHQYADIRPHIITIAKGMGNGFPVAGLLINPMIEAKKEMLGTTFGGNYLACSAAIAVLDVIEKEHLPRNALSVGNYLKEALKEISKIKEVRGMGLMIGIEFHQACAEIRKDLLTNHKIFTGASSNKNTLRILPSLAVTKAEIDQFIHALQSTLE